MTVPLGRLCDSKDSLTWMKGDLISRTIADWVDQFASTRLTCHADPSGSGKAVSFGNNRMLPWPRLFEPSLSWHQDLGLPWKVRSGVGCGSEMLWFRRVLNFKAEKFDFGETDPQRIPSFYLRREARNTPRPETDARNIPLRELPEVGKSF